MALRGHKGSLKTLPRYLEVDITFNTHFGLYVAQLDRQGQRGIKRRAEVCSHNGGVGVNAAPSSATRHESKQLFTGPAAHVLLCFFFVPIKAVGGQMGAISKNLTGKIVTRMHAVLHEKDPRPMCLPPYPTSRESALSDGDKGTRRDGRSPVSSGARGN